MSFFDRLFERDGKKLKSEDRRRLLRSTVAAGVFTGLSMLGFIPIVRRWRERLRPPGAIVEHEFLAACIKCGQCVQVCPVHAIHLADIDEGYGIGTPFLDARKQGCDFACDAPQCVLACPTGALSHDTKAKEQVRMGVARLAGPDRCLARKGRGFKGVARGEHSAILHRYMSVNRWKPIELAEHPYDLELCDLCVRECPISGAITMEKLTDEPGDKRRTPVVHQACVGCGFCETMCPAEPAAIVVDARAVWPAQQGA
jgi:ferredoxin-type protein NapG